MEVVPLNVQNVTNWDLLRHLAASRSALQTLIDAIPECLKDFTTVLFLPVLYLSPALKFLALGAARRRLQPRAKRFDDCAHRHDCGRVTAAFRRHTKLFRKLQWHQLYQLHQLYGDKVKTVSPCT